MKITKKQKERYTEILCNMSNYLTNKIWKINFDGGIIVNGRFSTTYGQFYSQNNQCFIEIATKVLVTNNYYLITDILLHELTHWYTYNNNLGYDDLDDDFINELNEVGSNQTNCFNVSEEYHKEFFTDKVQKYVEEMIKLDILNDIDTRVKNFIDDFKGEYKNELEDVFMNGYCYWFANILSTRFNGNIYYLPIMNHFVAKIYNNFYDIKGNANHYSETKYKWELYQKLEPLESERIKKYCIDKEN